MNEIVCQKVLPSRSSPALWHWDAPIGYRVAAVKVENSTAIGHQIFASGWLQEGQAWGRPVDVQPLPDGSLLVSDDLAGVIYRITYSA